MTHHVPLTVQIPEDLRRYLKIAAAERGASQSDVVAALLAADRKRDVARKARAVAR